MGEEGLVGGENAGQNIPEQENEEINVSHLLYSALEAINRTEGSALVKPVIEKIEKSGKELTNKEIKLVEDIDWWVQIIESGDKKRAREFYEENLKRAHDKLYSQEM